MSKEATPEQQLHDLNYKRQCGWQQRVVLWLARKQINRVAKAALTRAYERGNINSEQLHATAAIVDRILYPNWHDTRERFVNPGGDWFCDWCNKPMAESNKGYVHADGVCYCSQECAQEKDWNR